MLKKIKSTATAASRRQAAPAPQPQTKRKSRPEPEPEPEPEDEDAVVEDTSDEDSSEKEGSLAERFNRIAKSFSNNATDVPPGSYEAIIREAVVQEPDSRGQSVRLKFELCGSEFGDQNTITQWFRIFDEDDEPFEPGIKSLSYNFARLGLELDFNTIEETCAEISDDKPGIIVKVIHNEGTGKNQGRTFINASIERPCDNNVIQAYKDNIAY